jgi:putative hemolysin
LSTIQIGITSISVLNGILGEAAFADDIAIWLYGLGLNITMANYTATALVVTFITVISIIFGELVPKRIGLLFPETIARYVTPLMQGLATLARPLVWLLSAGTQGVLKLLQLDKVKQQGVTEEEISAQLIEGVNAGVIEKHEQQMVNNVFHLDDRSLSSLMTTREHIKWLQSTLTVKQALKGVAEQGAHSYYPVCKGDLTNIVGIVSSRELLKHDSSEAVLATLTEPAVFVPETLSGLELLKQFRNRAIRMVMVVNEYGDLQGLLTSLDLLEAITGELYPDHGDIAWATKESENCWLLDGSIPISEVKDRLDIKMLPDESKGHYNTLAGLLMLMTGELPVVGQVTKVVGWQFEITQVIGKRATQVRASKINLSTKKL